MMEMKMFEKNSHVDTDTCTVIISYLSFYVFSTCFPGPISDSFVLQQLYMYRNDDDSIVKNLLLFPLLGLSYFFLI